MNTFFLLLVQMLGSSTMAETHLFPDLEKDKRQCSREYRLPSESYVKDDTLKLEDLNSFKISDSKFLSAEGIGYTIEPDKKDPRKYPFDNCQ